MDNKIPLPRTGIFVGDCEGKVDINVIGVDGFTNGYILKTSKRGALKKLKRGEDPTDVFGRAAKYVAFDLIESLKWQSNEQVVDVRYGDGNVVTASFDSPDDRRRFIESLRSNMGEQLQETVEGVDAITATLPAIFVGGGTILVTVIGAYFLDNVDSSDVSRRGGKRGAIQLLQSLGTTGVLAAGGLILAGAIAFGIYRLKHCPQLHVVQRRP